MKIINKILSIVGLKIINKHAIVLQDIDKKALKSLFKNSSVCMNIETSTPLNIKLFRTQLDGLDYYICDSVGDYQDKITHINYTQTLHIDLKQSKFKFTGNIVKGIHNLYYYSNMVK